MTDEGQMREEIARLKCDLESCDALARLYSEHAVWTFIGEPFFDVGNEDAVGYGINCNDTFGYACADQEEFALSEAPELWRIYLEACESMGGLTAGYEHGRDALLIWAQARRGGPGKAPFIPEVQAAINKRAAAERESQGQETQ